MRSVYLAAACLALAACTEPAAEAPPAPPPPELPPQTVAYACLDEVAAEASYGPDGSLALTVGGETWPMNPAEAVSGARWVGETLEWWVTLEGGEEVATLRELNAQRIGEAVVTRCVRPTTGGVLAPEPPAMEAPETAPAQPETIPASAGACRAPALSFAAVSADAAAGSRFNTVAFTNEGSAVCTVEGYPRVTLIGENGQPRTGFTVNPEPGPYWGNADSIEAVTLQPGGRAYFDIVSTVIAGEVPGETEPCAPTIAVRASPPGDAGSIQAPVRLNPCNQRIRVTALRPTEAMERGG